MKLRAFVTLSAVCCLLLCGAWAVSWWLDLDASYVYRPTPWSIRAGAAGGVLRLIYWGSAPTLSLRSAEFGFTAEGPLTLSDRWLRDALIGFDVDGGSIGTGRVRAVHVPLWLPILLTALPPVLWWRRRRREGARGFEVAQTTADDPSSTCEPDTSPTSRTATLPHSKA